MLAAALGFVLVPLLRARRPDASERAKRAALEQARRAGALSDAEVDARIAALRATPQAAPSVSLLLPAALGLAIGLGSIALYRQIGEPRALDAVWQDAVAATASTAAIRGSGGEGDAPDMQQAIAALAERLQQNPDDLDGWMLLGRAYKTLERFEPAREALANAFRLAPEQPEVMIDYAEALVLASDSRRFEGEPHELLQRALSLQPEHPRGLWLLGIARYQTGEFTAAADTWDRLLASMPAEAEARDSLQERIAEARQRAGTDQAPPAVAAKPSGDAGPATAAPAVAAQSSGPRLTVVVDIAPQLKSQIGASDVLFVFARAAQGPRMPLAIQRLPAASLPVTVTLDDSTSMMPTLKLSTMPQVVVGARVSRSGQATPQPGDFEVLSDPIANTHSEPLRLTIDKVVP
jgi:cytochrome c-type biogenesis protein CcmH